MIVRSKLTYTATQYNARGDHPNEYVWAIGVPIFDEDPAKPFPASGRLGTLEECDPADLRYSVFETEGKENNKYFDLQLGWWILEREGKVVAVVSPERFDATMEVA